MYSGTYTGAESKHLTTTKSAILWTNVQISHTFCQKLNPEMQTWRETKKVRQKNEIIFTPTVLNDMIARS